MNDLFPKIPLIELCEPSRGIRYGILKVGTFVPDGIPVIRGGDIRDGVVTFDENKKVSREISEKFSRTILQGGEIVINLIAEAGHSAIVPGEFQGFNVSRDVAVIPIIESVSKKYIDYYLRSPSVVWWFHQRLQGSVTQKINLETLREVPVSLPPLGEQKAIANILGKLDDKIELKRKTSETLEGIAKALFKSWFVNFDPVRAKVEGRPTGLSNEISELFPDSFEDSELGEIPSGWSLMPLDKIANYLNGLALQKFPPKGDQTDLPIIKIAQLRKGDSVDSGKCSSELGVEYVIEDGDILFSWSGSLLVDIWVGGPGALNQHLFKVTSQDFKKWFYYWWTKHYLEHFQAIAQSKATTMGHIQRKHLSEALVVVPTKEVLEWMNKTFSPILNRQIQGRLESRTLTSLRDALLPRLISGELRVPDAEKMLEEAGV